MLPDPLAERLARSGVVAVVTVENPDDAGPIARALLAGGVGAIELTFRTARAAEGKEARRGLAGADGIERRAYGDLHGGEDQEPQARGAGEVFRCGPEVG